MPKRNPMFARSDIYGAAEEFLEVLAEHAETIWEPVDIAQMADDLTEKAFRVLRDPQESF